MLSDTEWRAALKNMEGWAFGGEDTPELADELAALVVRGRKTATTGLLREYEEDGEPLPRVGERRYIMDSRGRPVCVVELTEVRVMAFCEVDAGFARDEGEGDLSLESWRKAHSAFFSRYGGVTDETPVVCERFRVLHVFGGPWAEKRES
ncbi:MAG: ASCH domain-containing protein [Alphaproteobacteria bacterium]